MMARVLIGLGRAEASGRLEASCDDARVTLDFDDGRVVAATMMGRPCVEPEQVVEELSHAFARGQVAFRFLERGGPVFRALPEPIHAATLAMRLMAVALRTVDAGTLRAEVGRGTYRLTDSGEAWIEEVGLRPPERAVVFWLRRGVNAEEVLTLPGCGLAGYRFLAALKLVGAATRPGGAYPLMLRKRRQVRAQASPHALLDLPERAGRDEARRALRRLVRDLHPDRFEEGDSAGLRRASGEIVTALVDAEARISATHRD